MIDTVGGPSAFPLGLVGRPCLLEDLTRPGQSCSSSGHRLPIDPRSDVDAAHYVCRGLRSDRWGLRREIGLDPGVGSKCGSRPHRR